MAQAKETQRSKFRKNKFIFLNSRCLSSISNLYSALILIDLGNGRVTTNGNSLNPNNNPNLSSSFNSGLNNFGLKNSYTPGLPASIGPGTLQGPNSLGSGGSNNRSNHGSPQFDVSNLNSWNARNGKEIPSWLSTYIWNAYHIINEFSKCGFLM